MCPTWIICTKVLVVRFKEESMQKLVLIDAADMKTVEKVQIFPQYRVDPYSFGTGMELAREISGLAKNNPLKC